MVEFAAFRDSEQDMPSSKIEFFRAAETPAGPRGSHHITGTDNIGRRIQKSDQVLLEERTGDKTIRSVDTLLQQHCLILRKSGGVRGFGNSHSFLFHLIVTNTITFSTAVDQMEIANAPTPLDFPVRLIPQQQFDLFV
jgi:hypothetical protein